MRILIAETDPALARRLSTALSGLSEAAAEVCADLPALVGALAGRAPALLVFAFPGEDLAAVLNALRQRALCCPVLVLTGETSPRLRAESLLQGADDCLSKPLSMVEFRARCLALLRRAQAPPVSGALAALRFGSLDLDRLRREASVAGSPLRLTGREFLLLEQLALASGGVLSRSGLARGASAEANALDVHIAALRRKLREHRAAPSIETVRGVGFQLTPAPLAEAVRPFHFEAFGALPPALGTAFCRA